MIKTTKEMKMREIKTHNHYCDVCGKEMKHNYDEVEIEARIGDNFPECDCRDGYALDVCAECFLEKVKPCLEESLGVEFQEFDSEEGRYGW